MSSPIVVFLIHHKQQYIKIHDGGYRITSNHFLFSELNIPKGVHTKPPVSYWVTVKQKGPITNRLHPLWVGQLSGCDSLVRLACRPAGLWKDLLFDSKMKERHLMLIPTPNMLPDQFPETSERQRF